MIYKWNFVRVDIFKEIFNTYWNKEGNTEKQVIELQNFKKDETGETVRIFFGKGIKFNDWKKYNEDTYEFIKNANKLLSDIKGTKVDICDEAIISMCMTDGGPKVTPLRTETEHEELIFKGMIDNDIDSIKDDKSKLLTEMSQSFLQVLTVKDDDTGVFRIEGEGTGYIRVRAMDLKDWKENVKVYAETGKFSEEFTKDDINI